MFTKTTVSAIRALMHLGLEGGGVPLPPRQIAEAIGESPSYLAKVLRHLAKAGILRAHRGVSGGVTLNRAPDDISLLAIVEACQGTILADFCEEASNREQTCALHHAGAELHDAIVGVLSGWTLGHVVCRPRPVGMAGKEIPCWLAPPRETRARLAAGSVNGASAAAKGGRVRRATKRKARG